MHDGQDLEYVITQQQDGYRIAINGRFAVPIFRNPNDARLWCQAHARSVGQQAEILEVFKVLS